MPIEDNFQIYFDRPNIKGDIQVRSQCSGGGWKLGVKTKHPLFKECLIKKGPFLTETIITVAFVSFTS